MLADELAHVLTLVQAHPNDLHGLTLPSLLSFLTCASRLKDDIILAQSSAVSSIIAPKSLPPTITSFLSDISVIPEAYVDDLWDVFKNSIWEGNVGPSQSDIDALFRTYGHHQGFSMCSTSPILPSD